MYFFSSLCVFVSLCLRGESDSGYFDLRQINAGEGS